MSFQEKNTIKADETGNYRRGNQEKEKHEGRKVNSRLNKCVSIYACKEKKKNIESSSLLKLII